MTTEDAAGVGSSATLLHLIGDKDITVQGRLRASASEERSIRREGERRVALGALHDRLTRLARLVERCDSLTPWMEARLKVLLCRLDDLDRERRPRGRWRRLGRRLSGRPDSPATTLDIGAVWETVSDLDLTLLELASGNHCDDEYLRARLEEERRSDQVGPQRLVAGRTGSGLRWSDLYDPKELATLCAPLPASWSGEQRQRILELISGLYQARNATERERRAQEQLHTERLVWIRWLLTPFLVGAAACLAVALWMASWNAAGLQEAVGVLLAVLAGMLGAGLGGAQMLREESLRPNELPRFKAALSAQLLVGGAFGLIALALLRAGVLPTMQGDARYRDVVALAIYGFLAGYSEPFVIGVLQGLAGRPDSAGRVGRDHPNHSDYRPGDTEPGDHETGGPTR